MVKPSQALLAMVGLLCAGAIFSGLMLGTGQLGDLIPIVRIPAGAGCILLGFFAFYWAVKAGKTHHIDISGNGQIRIGEYIPSGTPALAASPGNARQGEIVQLMADSTIWPNLLLLRLQSEDQRVTIVNVLPDSIHGDGFRALSVACRWVAAHKNSTEDKNF